jgi:hypothetical protein
MIRAGAKGKDGRPILILGLSHDNLARLTRDPIAVRIDEILPGVVADVLIFAGESEETMAQALGSLIDASTRQTGPITSADAIAKELGP